MPYSKTNPQYKDNIRKSKNKYYGKTSYAPCHNQVWTIRDEVLVLSRTYTDSVLSVMIGRSVKAIQLRRARLIK